MQKEAVMKLREKAQIMDENAMNRAVIRMAHEIIEYNKGVENLYLIGIQRRGVPLAKRIAKAIEDIESKLPTVGILDITLYRDDLSELAQHPVLHATSIPFAVTGVKIVMVDDVLYTGRTARAGMDAIIDLGRPKSIQLAVLIDRGHRELPIRADYVGKNVPTSAEEVIKVKVTEIDGENVVNICERN